jgi:hypothetical protein
MSLQQWIPRQKLQVMRDIVIQKIIKGKFNSYISKLLSPNKPHDHTKVDKTFPYYADDNTVNRQLRKNEYLKKSEMLDKLADEGDGHTTLTLDQLSDVFYVDREQLLAWDISIDYVAEHVPDEIAKCLRITHLAKEKKIVAVPQFKSF